MAMDSRYKYLNCRCFLERWSVLKQYHAGWWQALRALLFPGQNCLACGKRGDWGELGLCEDCWLDLKKTAGGNNWCRQCATFLVPGKNYCYHCSAGRIYQFDGARAVFPYEGMVREYIRRFKYRGIKDWSEPLGILMGQAVENDSRFAGANLIIPVPLHPIRLRERGYNQSELLGRVLAKGLGIPLVPDLLRRKVHTPSQTGLNRKARWKNLKEAFFLEAKQHICRGTVLLIDDIYTTGATVDACAQILKEGGMEQVYVLTCAAGKQQ